MKKFTSYEEASKVEINNIEGLVEKLLKENVSLEIVGEEKPWTGEIDVKANDELIQSLKAYIDQEINKSNLNLLERIRLSYYKNNSLDVIDDEIKSIRENLKK